MDKINENIKEEAVKTEATVETKVNEKKTVEKEVISTEVGVAPVKEPTEEKAAKEVTSATATEKPKAAEKKTTAKASKKKPVAEKKPVAKNAKKPAAKKSSTSKPVSKPASKTESQVSTVVQYNNKDFDVDTIVESVKKDFFNKYSEDIKNIAVYIKPEDNKAYYVINDNITDSIDI